MFKEGEDTEFRFEPDWKAVFRRDFCRMCKNRNSCPYTWECHDMEEFLKNNEKYYANMDNDNTNNGDQ